MLAKIKMQEEEIKLQLGGLTVNKGCNN